ncbi:MAG TPA: hypothetical protein VKB86_22760 [Pyrinomonadaceae bacterium]|nr:hypothetical protein [Pyrinomonadaceae bacterium]
MVSRQLVRFLILVLLLPSYAFAQKPDATKLSDEERKAQQELEHKALGLLDDIIKESDSFNHAENRVRVKSLAANLLWKYDESRARAIFKDAAAAFVDLLKEQVSEDPAERMRLFQSEKELRGEMLRMLAEHDARMAREFMRATRPSALQANNVGQPQCPTCLIDDTDPSTDLNLAAQIASNDPKLALEIGEESLQKGFTYQLTGLLSSIREKDPDSAARLASEIMTKLRTDKLSSSSEARQVAVELLLLAARSPENETKEKAKNITPLLDQTSLHELTDMVAVEALRGPGNMEMLSQLHAVMPVVEKYAPERAEQLRRKSPQKKNDDGSAFEDESIDWEKYRPLIKNGNADELLAAASTAQPPTRDMLYQFAMSKMIKEGDLEHARQLVNEKVQDETRRKQMLEQLDKAEMVVAAEQGKIEQARKSLATLRTNEERVTLLTQLAMGAAAKGDKKTALKLLDEASGMINQRAKNIYQLGAQLLVAHAYAGLDPQRSFAILEPVVDQLNELLKAATVLGGFFVEELVKDDEIMLGPISSLLNVTSNETAQYFGDLDLLARADFDRTRTLIDKFERSEIRIMMRLVLAQSILAPQQKGALGADQINGLTIGGPATGGVVFEKDVP